MKYLEQGSIQKPCPKTWGELEGSDCRRFCESCSKHVYNLSSVSRLEAEALLRFKGGELCVAYRTAKDGRMMNASLWSRMRWIPTGLLAGLVGLFPVGCASQPRPAGKEPASTASCSTPEANGAMGTQDWPGEWVGGWSNMVETSSGKTKNLKK